MLQQRFFDNFYFFACGFYFLIKFFLFFVQFSVHFLFFTCFFLLQKNTASFQFFIVAHPLTHLILFVFFFFSDRKLRPCDSWMRTSENVAAARWAQSRNFRVKKQVDGVLLVCVCVCVFVWMCDFLFCFLECMLFFFTSLYTYVTFL